MVIRVVAATTWSLATGLAGGFLLISPWALGVQSGGDWSNVTRTQFWTGAGLVLLGAFGLALVAAHFAALVRGGGRAQAHVPGARPAGAGANGEMDAALVALANALVADLNRQPAQSAPPQHAPQPPRPPTYPPQPASPPPAEGGDPWRTR